MHVCSAHSADQLHIYNQIFRRKIRFIFISAEFAHYIIKINFASAHVCVCVLCIHSIIIIIIIWPTIKQIILYSIHSKRAKCNFDPANQTWAHSNILVNHSLTIYTNTRPILCLLCITMEIIAAGCLGTRNPRNAHLLHTESRIITTVVQRLAEYAI